MRDLETDHPDFISLTDANRLQQLALKLEECEKRLDSFRDPEFEAFIGNGMNFCKAAILRALLKDRTVLFADLYAELRKKLGDHFSREDFLQAWCVIDDYATTGGARVTGGTGLPSPEGRDESVSSEEELAGA